MCLSHVMQVHSSVEHVLPSPSSTPGPAQLFETWLAPSVSVLPPPQSSQKGDELLSTRQCSVCSAPAVLAAVPRVAAKTAEASTTCSIADPPPCMCTTLKQARCSLPRSTGG